MVFFFFYARQREWGEKGKACQGPMLEPAA